MLPMIRRIRRPLLPCDPADGHVTENQQDCNSQVRGLPSANEALTPQNCPADPQEPKKLASQSLEFEKRSDFGQFRSDSPNPASQVNPGSNSVVHNSGEQSAENNSQPSTPAERSRFTWSRQSSESAADFQLFAAWLQLPAPRSYRKASAALGSSVHRLRRVGAHNQWQPRTAAFDEFRANTVSQALTEIVDSEIADWKARAEKFRLQEWSLHEQMIESALAISAELKRRPTRARLSDVAKLFELASTLGRRSCGLPLENDSPEAAPIPIRPDVESALAKIYGDGPEFTPEPSPK